MKFKTFSVLILLTAINFAQELDIIPQLKMIEAGKTDEVREELINLKRTYSNHPDLIFLEAVITEDGEKSKDLYELIYNNFPNSRFADAALFRSFSYYYALGLYKRAEKLKVRLEKEYPKSPYLKNTEREYPEVDEMIIVDPSPYKIRRDEDILFTVQAGAFSVFKNADELKNRFLNNGLVSRITPKKVNDIQLHIVTVGEYKDRAIAEKFLLELENNYSLKGRVIELN